MNMLLNAGSGTFSVAVGRFFSSIGEAFSTFTLIDAIDILFLTAVCFFVLRFFKGRKAGAVMAGVAICLCILVAAYAVGLEATYFIFSGVFKIGALAIVIIFQPEIRDALEKIGSGSISGIRSLGDQKKKKQLYYQAIDNICAAVSDLSRTKTGALIVISRTTSLEDVIQTGVPINADVNSFLIRNLFFNKAPLHDGAVVVDGARIAAAGCLLPLTRRFDIDGDLGTRHRAALGMSETSDAVIVVVSEETGIISIACECALTRNYTHDTLRSFLLRKLVREEGRHGKSREA